MLSLWPAGWASPRGGQRRLAFQDSVHMALEGSDLVEIEVTAAVQRDAVGVVGILVADEALRIGFAVELDIGLDHVVVVGESVDDRVGAGFRTPATEKIRRCLPGRTSSGGAEVRTSFTYYIALMMEIAMHAAYATLQGAQQKHGQDLSDPQF